MKTKIPTSNKQGFLQMISRADAEQVVLQQQAQELDAKLRATQAEMSTLQARSASRRQSAETARQTVEALRADLMRANAQDLISEGTLAASNEPSPKDLTRFLQKASDEHAAILARNQGEQAKDEARMQALQVELGNYQGRLHENVAMQEALATTREQAVANLGESEYQGLLAQLHALQTDLAIKEHEATDARAGIDTFAGEALPRLANWPNLQEQLRDAFPPYQDIVTSFLEAQMAAYDALLEHGKDINTGLDAHQVRQVLGRYGNLVDLLTPDAREFWPALGFVSETPQQLQGRRALYESLLQKYREVKQCQR